MLSRGWLAPHEALIDALGLGATELSREHR